MNNLYFEIIAFFYIIKQKNIIQNFKKKFFSEPTIVEIFDVVKDFVTEYKVEPTMEQVIELVNLSGTDDIVIIDGIKTLWQSKNEVNKYSEEWLNTNITAWGKFRNFYTSLENTIAYVQSMPSNIAYSDSENYINKAVKIFNNGATFTVNNSEGHDFFDIDNHIIPESDTHSTGYNFMDLCLKGGFTKKGLHVVMGAPKAGKSMWLCNLAANSVRNGYHTIYITLEMSYQLVSQRIGSNLFDINIDDYDKIVQDRNFMTKTMQNFFNQSIVPPGKLIIEEYPTSTATASDIEAFVLRKEDEISKQIGEEFKFDNVMIDYVNIMRDQKGGYGSSDNSYQKIKNICEDVRAMAQRNHWAVISLTQTNRSGMGASDMDMGNVAESAGLIATVDSLFGIIQTPIMNAMNIYYLKALALRNSKHMYDKKKYNFDPFHLRITEDINEGIIPGEVELPKAYTSATAQQVAAANKQQQAKSGSKDKIQQPYTFVPPVMTNGDELKKSENALGKTEEAMQAFF